MDVQMERWNGPATRPAFNKATQVKIKKKKQKNLFFEHILRALYFSYFESYIGEPIYLKTRKKS